MTVNRPFLLLSTRPEDEAAAEELASFTAGMQVPEGAIEQRRLESAPLGDVDLEAYSGVLLGGSPFNNSDLVKSQTQLRVEREVGTLVREIIDRDFPLMGACYGIGTVGTLIGATLGDEYAEEAGLIQVSLTERGVDDPLLDGLPEEFDTLVGHKEAVSSVPETATVLVSGEACPIQMFRVGQNVYATQFHPELTAPALEARLRLYAHLGYVRADVMESNIAEAYTGDFTWNNRILANFAEMYAR
ncbi:glutamine amidotransferase [Corynebacterium sp. Marseille-P4321]|uniref:glutamine amidotransferase n=1 Tax=Corynebacterium sp. Marseille-P4321 TaxID=2736603 RepID=UPI0009E221F0|nr:glutamine amidotransferase [Corynebacterium sp. Marseille-P4321]